MIEDNDGNLWGSISGGIFRLNTQRSEIKIYGKNHGVDVRNPANSANKGSDGEVFFGYSTGYFAFYPDLLKTLSKPPKIAITNFRIADREVKPGRKKRDILM